MSTWNELRFGVIGDKRKQMVTLIAECIGEAAVYRKTPTCSYDIGSFNVSKDGDLTWTEETKPDKVNKVIAILAENGFTPKEMAPEKKKPKKKAEKPGVAKEKSKKVKPAAEPGNFTVELPKDYCTDEDLAKLDQVLECKGKLIKKAIGAESLEYKVSEDKVSFAWFTLTGGADEGLKTITSSRVHIVHPSGTPSTIVTSSCPGKRRSTNHSLYRRCAASSRSLICFWLFSMRSS